MSYAYEQSVPFKYKKYTELKSVTFTDEVKTHLDDFYQYIESICEEEYKNSKGKVDKDKLRILIAELASKYKELRNQYIKPVVEKEYKYKELLYTQEEVDFIFACSYTLLDKFNMSQSMLCEIFFGKQRERKYNPKTGKEEWVRTKENKFSKLGCFPVRCHDAYTKLDDVSARKCLIPNDSNSIGIQIAECINKKVQAVYACSAFVGVSNDLDLFANISSTDKKAYVLTSPMHFEPDDTPSFERANYAFCRYQFALGNQMFNDEDKYVPAGELKKKIIFMFESGDISILSSEEQDELLQEMLLSNVNMEAYMNMGYRYSDFQVERDEYRACYEDMIIEKEKLEDDYQNYLLEYYVEDYNPEEKRKSLVLSEDEIVEKQYLMRKKMFETQEQKVLEYINFPTLLGTKEMLISAIRKSAKSNTVFKKLSGNGGSETNVVFSEPTYEDRLKSAASYWIAEVLANYDGNEDYLKEVMDYLGKRSPIFKYLDSLNYVPSGKMDEANPTERKNIHIYMRDEKMNISSELEGLGIKLAKDEKCPIMVYLDKDAMMVEEEQIQKLLTQQRVVLIVHDTDGVVKSYMDVLNKSLGLYIKCSKGIG